MTERNLSHGDSSELFATRMMRARSRQSGQEILIKASIGKPFWIEAGVEAACSVTFEGLYGRQPDIRGIDPVDALRNAINLIELLFKAAADDYDLYWLDGEPFESNLQ